LAELSGVCSGHEAILPAVHPGTTDQMSTKLTADPEAKAERRRKVLVGAGALTAIAVVGGLVTLAVIQNPPPQTREDIEIAGLQTFEGLSANHVSTPVDYEQSPPVGGDHASAWLNCGVYTEPVPNENAVHALEHGAAWVAYDSEALSQEQVDALRTALPAAYVVLALRGPGFAHRAFGLAGAGGGGFPGG
ncbi:DUF3105 domain-containing protein, partial [Micrococcus luteus]|nr:DUF3105 domain-containing protein [Micrococcus luteus]